MNYLPLAIASCESLCDEFILVDSGSSDGSGEWAQEKAATDNRFKYFRRPWPGNFADQRNFAIDQAQGKWILSLDADEELDEKAIPQIREALQNPKADAFLLEIRNYTNDFTELGFRRSSERSGAAGYVPTFLNRLFKNDDRIRYSGIIHERIEPSLESSKLISSPLSAVIHHSGKLKEAIHRLKAERLDFYESLAESKVRNNPWDAQAHWELGVIFQKQRRLEQAEHEFARAIELAPEVEEFESYFLLSLYQQNAWPRILKYTPRSRYGHFYQALAKAESDTTAIEKLTSFKDLFSQAPLMAFEIALRRGNKNQIEKLRSEAEASFSGTGLIEFLEGVFLKSQQKYHEAVHPLSKAAKLKQPLAYQDYLICLIKTEQMPRVVEFFRSLTPLEQESLSEDSLKMIDLAHLSLGMGRDRISTLRSQFKKT